jgi:hypothetical protein
MWFWVLRIIIAFVCGDTLQELPLLYLKGGSIIATGPVAHYVDERTGVDDPLTLIVVLDQYGMPLFHIFSLYLGVVVLGENQLVEQEIHIQMPMT